MNQWTNRLTGRFTTPKGCRSFVCWVEGCEESSATSVIVLDEKHAAGSAAIEFANRFWQPKDFANPDDAADLVVCVREGVGEVQAFDVKTCLRTVSSARQREGGPTS